MRFYIDNGFLEYEIHGEGNPLFFIHGYPLSRKIWIPQTNALAATNTVITLDLRGHGDSFPFEGIYPMDLLAEDCKKLLDHLQIADQVIICGLSMGGYISLAFYRLYPTLIKSMILMSTRAGPDSPEGKINRDNVIKNTYQYGSSYISNSMIEKLFSPRTLENNPVLVNEVREIMAKTSINGIIGASLGMRDRPDSTNLLRQIICPALIMLGEEDQLISEKETEVMNNLITNSRLIKINAAGHLPNLEQPDKVNHALINFISEFN